MEKVADKALYNVVDFIHERPHGRSEGQATLTWVPWSDVLRHSTGLFHGQRFPSSSAFGIIMANIRPSSKSTPLDQNMELSACGGVGRTRVQHTTCVQRFVMAFLRAQRFFTMASA